MLDNALRSNPPQVFETTLPASVRGDSELRASFVDVRTQIYDRYERGALRLRYPRADGRREAVIVNTGGGITGGDRLAIELHAGEGTTLTATSQAAEKIYRSDGPPAHLTTRLRLDANARLDWMPQETIVFERAAAERTIDVEMAASARLTMVEQLVLGRVAHGEMLHDLHWLDRWRIRRAGTLVFAENVRIIGDAAALMQRAAIGGGARALATIVHVAPDAHARLTAVRDALEPEFQCGGASAWNGMLVARLAAQDPRRLRDAVTRVAIALTEGAMPRSWNC